MKKTNFLTCVSCGCSYKLDSFSDLETCPDCLDKVDNAVYDKEYEADVLILTNPQGKAQAVYVD